MTTATAERMNLNLQKNDTMLSAKVPDEMKKLVKKIAKRLNMTDSAYIKMAINNQLNLDINTNSNSTIANKNHKPL